MSPKHKQLSSRINWPQVLAEVGLLFLGVGLALLANSLWDARQDRISVVGGGSIYPAVQNLLLAARAEGLGCVLTTLLCAVEAEVRELLGIPAEWGTAAAVPLGYPVGGGHGPIRRAPVDQLVFSNRFGEAYVQP